MLWELTTELVSKGTKDWDELLEPVLFANQLMDSMVGIRYSTVATEYAKKLCRD